MAKMVQPPPLSNKKAWSSSSITNKTFFLFYFVVIQNKIRQLYFLKQTPNQIHTAQVK